MADLRQHSFPSSFYVANLMEVFERFAWYGMYTLLALYLTTPKSLGGLDLSQSEKGLIMGVVPFFLYLFPILSGALADRYGYRRMFIISFVIMAPCYFLLGQVKEMWSFMAIFMLVALGAGIFKPVVTGTIGRTTHAGNRGLGFGIFYMMVNIGGALGPLIVPIIQKKLGWDWVFGFAAIWIAINFIPVLFFYKEPEKLGEQKSLKQVLQEIQLVLGNGRLALLVFPLLFILIAYNANLIGSIGHVESGHLTILLVVFLVTLSLVWDFYNKRYQTTAELPWFKQKMRLGNKPFIVYLIIMSGFWTVYMQLFVTFPNYVRDFVDTADVVSALKYLGPWFYETFAAVDTKVVIKELVRLSNEFYPTIHSSEFLNAKATITALDLKVPDSQLFDALNAISHSPNLAAHFASAWSQEYRQISPVTIMSLDFIMIVFFQILISKKIKNWQVLPTLITGTGILAFGLWIGGLAHGLILGGAVLATSVILFAIGEMIASPKSQEYVASFSPKDKVAMFMGYYFVAIALGSLFAGLLSGWLYESIAKDMGSPDLMWAIIGGVGVLTCLALYIFHRTMADQIEQQQMAVA